MKKCITFLTVLSLLLSLTGCGNKTADTKDLTVANKIMEQFKAEVTNTTDLEALANTIMEQTPEIQFATIAIPVEEGFLMGFREDITGFNSAVCFGPIISSIPFIGYLFETDDVDSLEKTLTNHYNLDWNICTSAEEMVVDHVDNYVCFVMAPKSLEDDNAQ